MPERVVSVKARRVGFEKDRGVLEVDAEEGFSFVRVGCDPGQARQAQALAVLRPLSDRGVNIRLMRIHQDSLTFMVPREHLPLAREALLVVGTPVDVREECGAVAVVVPGLRSIPGLMARVGEALYARGIEVLQTADSHSSVLCVIPGERAADAVACLRAEFALPEETSSP